MYTDEVQRVEPEQGDSPGATIGTRADAVRADLERRLLRGDFLLDERLGEERLAALVGASRTPVREALLRLGAEGLVERHPEGGWRAVAPDLASSRALYEARQGLELQALIRPGEGGVEHDRSALLALRDAWLALAEAPPAAGTDFVHHDEAFHITLAAAAGNPVIVELLGVVNQRIRAVRMHDFLSEARVLTTIDEHVAVVEAVLAGRVDRASSLLRLHIYESMAVVEARVEHALERMLSRTEDAG